MKQPISNAASIKELLEAMRRVVIVQADNPDGDSLASSLALEQIFGDMGKEPILYCGIDMPSYLSYLPGWDRVQSEIPRSFDVSVIVDTSAISLLESLEKNGQKSLLATKPSIILDHHDVDCTIPFATVIYNQPAVATGEIIYELAQKFSWPRSRAANDMLAASILSDSLGLVSEATTARTIHIIGELVESGVSIASLEANRRETMRKSPKLIKYKGELLQRIEYFFDNKIASITIPWVEIEEYSHAYNPPMLVLDDMRLTEGTEVAIAFKVYRGGKITAKIRCNYGKGIAADLAKHFGGGGHSYASGFKLTSERSFNEVKSECINLAAELLDKFEKENSDEAPQHSNSKN